MRTNNSPAGRQNRLSAEEEKKKKELDILEAAVSDEFTRLLRSYDNLLTLFIIKAMSSEEKAMSVAEITEQLNYLFGMKEEDLFSERTIRRKLENFVASGDACDRVKEQIKRALLPLLGGTIEYRAADGIESGVNKTGNGSQRRYYFEPVLNASDLDMIYGALMSSRYLSEEEKSYLLSRLSLLQPDYESTHNAVKLNRYSSFNELPALPAKPARNRQTLMPMDSSVFLKNVQYIYDAIQNKYQLQIIYGIYEKKEGSSSVVFIPRNEERPYILNPYAMLWNNGEYYLVATHRGYENPVHFRLDRILRVTAYMIKDRSGNMTEAKRAPIPPDLAPFFKREQGRQVFDGIKYANTYPDMKIYHKAHPVTCIFECTSVSLQILVDNFGSGIRLEESTLPHSADELDFNGRPQHFLTATVNNVQYENALLFCIENARTIKLLDPSELVEEVKKELKRIAEEYQGCKTPAL